MSQLNPLQTAKVQIGAEERLLLYVGLERQKIIDPDSAAVVDRILWQMDGTISADAGTLIALTEPQRAKCIAAVETSIAMYENDFPDATPEMKRLLRKLQKASFS